MKNSISKKIFLITFLVVFILLTSFLLLQISFFDTIYKNEKATLANKIIDKFITQYQNDGWNTYRTYYNIEKINIENNIMISITDKNNNDVVYNSMYSKSYTTVIKINNKNYFFEFNNAFCEELFEKGIPSVEDKISINGYINNDQLEVNSIETTYGKIENFYNYIENKQILQGEIIEVTQYDYNFFPPDVIEGELSSSFNFIDSSFYMFGLNSEISNLNDDFIIINKNINKDNSLEIIHAYVPLQPVDEAMGVLVKYYIYFMGIFTLVLLLFSYLFSKKISKPLLEIEKVSSKMANMDFNAKCNDNRTDEIGKVAKNLNLLSNNLSSTLNELEKNNKSLNEFVSNAAHELKTPLSILESYAEGARDNINEAKKQEYLEIIIEEIRKTNKLVNNLLELSKLDSGEKHLKLNKININNIFEDSLVLFEYIAADKGMKILLNCSDIMVKVDESLISNVINNLISNAIFYGEENTNVIIDVTEDNNKTNIKIINNGMIKNTEKVFDRFYREEKSRNKEKGGTGIGLSIVKAILDLHESEYAINNVSNKVVFEFTLVK